MSDQGRSVVIWDADHPRESSEGTLILWRGFPDDTMPHIVSIPRLIEENSEKLRARYLALIYEIGELNFEGRRLIDHLRLRPGFSYWWMTLLIEKSNWSKSPQIDNAIRMLAFSDWTINRNFVGITLVSADKTLAECLRMWCETSNVPFNWQRLNKPLDALTWSRRVYSVLPFAIQSIVWLLHYVFKRWPLRCVGLESWRQTNGRITFISYLFNLVPDAQAAGRYESRYWAHLPQELKNEGCTTNWLHLYVQDEILPCANSAAEKIRAFNDTGQGIQNHVTLDSFLTVQIVGKSFCDWFRLAWTGRRVQRLIPRALKEGAELWTLLEDDWRRSTVGITGISNSLYLNLFEAATKALPKQQVGVYLQENQGWEFGLIHSWNAAGHGNLIGAPHSCIRFWDLRYFFDPRSYSHCGTNSLPLPDQIALNGRAATDAYLKSGYPAEKVVQVEALRYLYLDSGIARPVNTTLVTNNYLRLLVLGDYQPANTRLQMRLLEQAVHQLPAHMTIIVKPHPACPISALDYPSLQITIVMESISKLLNESDVAYSSSVTSAAVDAYCAGLPVISVLDANTLNLSPLRGCDDVFYVSTPDELASALLSTISGPPVVTSRQDFFTIDKELPRWRKLLGERIFEGGF